MTTQILRTLDRWRFETPLSLALGASAGFAAFTAPGQLFDQIPVAGDMGTAGRAIVAALLAIVSGGIGYVAMRRPVKAAPAPVAEPVEEIPEEDQPSGMPAERFARFRRADRHPDAPPREPIFASRDLGEPFMEVGTPPVAETQGEEPWWPETTIPDADYVEVDHDATPVPEIAPAAELPVAEEAVVEEAPAAAPATAPIEAQAAPRGSASIAGMMERLSSGLERRAAAGAPPRDPGPALRNALAELNRLAEKRD